MKRSRKEDPGFEDRGDGGDRGLENRGKVPKRGATRSDQVSSGAKNRVPFASLRVPTNSMEPTSMPMITSRKMNPAAVSQRSGDVTKTTTSQGPVNSRRRAPIAPGDDGDSDVNNNDDDQEMEAVEPSSVAAPVGTPISTDGAHALFQKIWTFQCANGLEATPNIKNLLWEYVTAFMEYQNYIDELRELGFVHANGNLYLKSALEDIPLMKSQFLAVLLYPPGKTMNKGSLECVTVKFMRQVMNIDIFMIVDLVPAIPEKNADVAQRRIEALAATDHDLVRIYRKRVQVMAKILEELQGRAVIYVGGRAAENALKSVVGVATKNHMIHSCAKHYFILGIHPSAGMMNHDGANDRVIQVLQLVAAVVKSSSAAGLGDYESALDNVTKEAFERHEKNKDQLLLNFTEKAVNDAKIKWRTLFHHPSQPAIEMKKNTRGGRSRLRDH